jgi:hypothetical protein
MIQPAQVVKRHADLQDALVQETDVAPFGAPKQLQRLMLFEELSAVELRDALEEFPRRRFVARHEIILEDDD